MDLALCPLEASVAVTRAHPDAHTVALQQTALSETSPALELLNEGVERRLSHRHRNEEQRIHVVLVSSGDEVSGESLSSLVFDGWLQGLDRLFDADDLIALAFCSSSAEHDQCERQCEKDGESGDLKSFHSLTSEA
jgi:hypothetical protein